ncbi:hypothetical protein N9L77_02835 [Pseudomonadales bacterium]|nr:hypothetical protein [Pseudomonadales bacterium]
MSSPKELKYFTDQESKGIDWYLGFFEKSSSYSCRGEFASNYIYNLASADKIKGALGNVKIIAVVREPVSRALSHIKHLIRDGEIPKMSGEITRTMLEQILQSHPQVLSNSHYLPGLTKFIETFGIQSIFIVNQSTCLSNGKSILGALWKFLEVDEISGMGLSDEIVSVGINPKFAMLERVRIIIFKLLKSNAPSVINWVKKIGLSSYYRRVNRGDSLVFCQDAADYIEQKCASDWYTTQLLLSIK